MPAYANLISPIISEFEQHQEQLFNDYITSSLRSEEWKPVSPDDDSK